MLLSDISVFIIITVEAIVIEALIQYCGLTLFREQTL